MNPCAKIGLYDSGLGGLGILRALQAVFPQAHFVYFADTAHLPYGEKSAEEICRYAQHILEWFAEVIRPQAVVPACHTSCAVAGHVLAQEGHPFAVLGLIEPFVQALSTLSGLEKIGFLGTAATVQAGAHEAAARRFGFRGPWESVACHGLATAIEETQCDWPLLQSLAESYLGPLNLQAGDVLVYGCTHYPLLRALFADLLPSGVVHLDPGQLLADSLRFASAQRLAILPEEGAHFGLPKGKTPSDESSAYPQAQQASLMESPLSGATLSPQALQMPVHPVRVLKGTEISGQVEFYCSGDPSLFAQKLFCWSRLPPVGLIPPAVAFQGV